MRIYATLLVLLCGPIAAWGSIHVDVPASATPSAATDALLFGDYNDTGRVEQGDLDLVLLNWTESATPPPNGWIKDLPAGRIDQAELDNVLLNWGKTAAPGSPGLPGGVGGTPEPASLAVWAGLLVLVGAVVWKRRVRNVALSSCA